MYNLLKPREGNIVKSAKQMQKGKPQKLILNEGENTKKKLGSHFRMPQKA